MPFTIGQSRVRVEVVIGVWIRQILRGLEGPQWKWKPNRVEIGAQSLVMLPSLRTGDDCGDDCHTTSLV
jgi:hypothetical protein